MITLAVYYIAYSTITGEYGYMKYFIIFYTLLLIDSKIFIGREHVSSQKLASR